MTKWVLVGREPRAVVLLAEDGLTEEDVRAYARKAIPFGEGAACLVVHQTGERAGEDRRLRRAQDGRGFEVSEKRDGSWGAWTKVRA